MRQDDIENVINRNFNLAIDGNDDADAGDDDEFVAYARTHTPKCKPDELWR